MVGTHMLFKTQLLSAALMRASGKSTVVNGLKALRVVDERIMGALSQVDAWSTACAIFKSIHELQITSRSLEHLGPIVRVTKPVAQQVVKECGKFKQADANKRADALERGYSNNASRGSFSQRGRARGRGARSKQNQGSKFCNFCKRPGHSWKECYSRPNATAVNPRKKGGNNNDNSGRMCGCFNWWRDAGPSPKNANQ